MADDTEYRQIVHRLLPGSREKARRLAVLAGACRFVWNAMLDQHAQLVAAASRAGPERLPGVSFFTSGKAFIQLRRVTPWPQEMPCAPVRYTLKYQADAWQRYFREEGGRPRFRRRGNDSVTLRQDIRIHDGKLHVPKIGPIAAQGRQSLPRGRAGPRRHQAGRRQVACDCLIQGGGCRAA